MSLEKTHVETLDATSQRATSPLPRRKASPTMIENESIISALESVSQYAKGDLLDVGCGEIPYRSLFSSSLGRYVGMDRNPPSGAKQRSLIALIGDACCLPVKADSFDTLLSTQVLEHLPEPGLFFQEANRVLNQGGHLILTAPQSWEVHEAPHDYYRYTCYGLRHLAEKNGFRVMVLRSRGGFFALLGQMLITHLQMQNRSVQRMAQLGIAAVFQFLDRRNPMKDDTAGYVMVAKNERSANEASLLEGSDQIEGEIELKESPPQNSSDTMNTEKSIDYSFSELPLKGTKKILIIRSSRMWHVHSIIRSLRSSLTQGEISVLAQPSAQKELLEGGVGNVITYGGANFNVFQMGWSLIRKIRNEKFDLCVIPYNNPYGQGYFHVHLIALLSGARHKVFCDKESRVKGLSAWRLSGLSQVINAIGDSILLIGVIGLMVPAAVLVAKLWRKRDND